MDPSAVPAAGDRFEGYLEDLVAAQPAVEDADAPSWAGAMDCVPLGVALSGRGRHRVPLGELRDPKDPR
jgi:hypothetical protein